MRPSVPEWRHLDAATPSRPGTLPRSGCRQDVKDVSGGKLIATVKDSDGNTLVLMQSP